MSVAGFSRKPILEWCHIASQTLLELRITDVLKLKKKKSPNYCERHPENRHSPFSQKTQPPPTPITEDCIFKISFLKCHQPKSRFLHLLKTPIVRIFSLPDYLRKVAFWNPEAERVSRWFGSHALSIKHDISGFLKTKQGSFFPELLILNLGPHPHPQS